jgi:hypothetical protein
MNDQSLNDPLLQSLEARLAAIVPQVSQVEQQQLLYQCAFAAGRQSGIRAVRCWQAASAVLVCLVFGLSALYFDHRQHLARRDVAPRRPPWESVLAAESPEVAQRQTMPLTIELDAWQIRASEELLTERTVALSDPHLRSMTMGAMTHQLLE